MLERLPAYRPLTGADLPLRLAHRSEMTDALGPITGWRVREIGDGNLNLVFVVEGSRGALIVKQALPYARVVGEGWPLSLARATFEFHALTRLGARDPGRMPKVLAFDETQALIVMEHLTPHLILRRGLIAGECYDDLGRHLGHYLARTLFRGSDLHLGPARRKADTALFCANVELTGITEDLVFTDPFLDHPRNRHTPGLEREAAHVRADRALTLAACEMKARFATRSETLLHGDLHTGSVMATATDTRVIDPEFAVYGPMGFDVGALLGNLFLAFFAQPGLPAGSVDRAAYGAFILDLAATVWASFTAEFSALWHSERAGMLGGRDVFEGQGDPRGADLLLKARLGEIWEDTLGFAGIEMHRRILGLAHAAELEAVADERVRAACERRALKAGRALAVGRTGFARMADVCALMLDLAGGARP
ncbi:S-methyl-5-thioribose kinase [Aquabacter sp. L1I39]|uniref:S-methyl-5-thioribose kinase n=1 Tax=Aquabacter sp. L1I39 TaxID=2820278 RepID=UPI001ADA223D|nr:S-methyl-5-thioribose kinase [Aquabacter sp. L1I39]QTL02016.1 S-methyl-5-thioribose kinase [Aquabacter sp. L1I39]